MIAAAYRAYAQINTLCLELIRQFYVGTRYFRVTGAGGGDFVSYSGQGIRGARRPVFDIRITAQRKNPFARVSQNELATQFFQMGFFNPQMTDQALMCLDLMDFDGKDQVMQKVAQNGTMFQKLIQYMQMSLMLAQTAAPQMVPGLSQDIMQTMGAGGGAGAAVATQPVQADHIDGLGRNESSQVANARERSAEASQPDGGRVTNKKEEKK